MFDGVKIQDVSVDIDALLTNNHLTFTQLMDSKTGFVFSSISWALNRGLTFRLVPRRNEQGCRVEVKGSLHKFHNNGQHNADQFTVHDLLLTLDELVCSYGFDLSKSKINNIEFGVNVALPFPVSQVLKNLVCYRSEPFYLDTNSDTPYYVCNLQRYAVKIYDKGKQKGLNGNLLRFEIRVKKMEYFNRTGVKLYTLADLLNVANYKRLGASLLDTFNEITFDDPAITPAKLNRREREIYRNGRNPRYWQTPDNLTPKQTNNHYKRLSRDRQRYRALLEQHGGGWRREVAALISQIWNQLTAVDDYLLTQIDNYKTAWQNQLKPDTLMGEHEGEHQAEDCQELTDISTPIGQELTNISNPELSGINPLYSGLDSDTNQPGVVLCDRVCREPVHCLVTGIVIDSPRPRQRFVSATQLRNLYNTNRPVFDNVTGRFLTDKQAGATLEQQCYYMAHNIRNAYANQFNNPLRRLKKYIKVEEGQQQLLFPFQVAKAQLTHRIQAGIDYRKGTRYELRFT